MDNGNPENSPPILNNETYEKYNEINEDSLCIICKGMVKNVCNGLCGCKYCWECIEAYLNGDEKCCPGEFDECREQLLNIDGNILVDQSTQSKISRIVVKQTSKFPDEFNSFKDNLINDEIDSIRCPYFNLGCHESKLVQHDMDDHLNFQNCSHTRLLMQWIDSMRNGMKAIKLDIATSRKENIDLKKEIERMKSDFDKKQVVISELLVKDHIKSQQIEYLMNQLGQEQIEYNGSIPLVVYEPSSPLEDIDEMEFETEIPPVKPDLDTIIDSINDKMEIFDRKLIRLKTYQEKLNYGEFVWAINNFSEKIAKARKATNREIYSESFYTHKNGYKMCLRVDPSGISTGKGSHLAVHFCIVEGPFDDILQWPMKHSVTFALINQESGLIHTSRTARFEDVSDNLAWNKPSHDKKNCFGYHKFISMDELLTNDQLCRDDQIFIICSVDTTM